MHFLLLGIGVIIGIYGLYRFFLNANIHQIKALVMGAGFTVLCAALFFLAVTGRLPAALGLLAALWPFGMAWLHNKSKTKTAESGTNRPASAFSGPMTCREALEVLGLPEGATQKEIKDAYTRLMKKVHPDQEGSKWMAAKLNEAKSLLLEKHKPDA